MTLVEHLDELRDRLIIVIVTFFVALGLCFWQDDLLLEIANRWLPADKEATTLSPTEPLFTTIKVAAYAALMLSLPVLLYQFYAFVIPALTPVEKRTLRPFVLAIPILFCAGVAFGYFVVLPAALDFLLNFNDAEFSIQVRAQEYYGFFGMTLFALGLLFQIPPAVLALTRLGVVTPDGLAAARRYAILVIAVLAAALPGGDPISMFLIMAPLIVLYEGSIVLARILERREKKDVSAEPAAAER